MKKDMLPLVLAAVLIVGMAAYAASDEKSVLPEQQIAEAEGQDMVTLKVPLFSAKFASMPVAVVNGDPITLEDFKDSIGSMHSDVKEGKTAAGKNYPALLNRLITVKLILQEARNIGLDELPEVKDAIASYSRITLLELFQKNKVKDVKPDEKVLDKIYKQMVKEYKVKSALFDKEEDARNVEGQVGSGGNFDELIDKAVSAGVLKVRNESQFFKSKDMLPQVSKVLSEMKEGAISPVIQVGPGFAIFRLDEVRYPDDPAAMAQARQQAVRIERVKAMEAYNKTLAKKYVKVKKSAFDSLNYEKGNIEKLLKDKRGIADIKGDKPVTVGELTEALAMKFYHGVESAKSLKKMNDKKAEIAQEVFAKRVYRLEAVRQGIDKSEEFGNMVKDYRDSVIFGAFIQKVIVPDIKLSNDELKEYYAKHVSEFSFPEMMRIRALAFGKKEDANIALEKLRKGTDFQWLSDNAEGRIEKGADEFSRLGSDLLIVSELPEDIRRSVEGAKAEDSRLYNGKGGYIYVLYIKEKVPASPQPFDEVKEAIAGRIYNEKLGKAVEEWADKLRKASDVTVYVTGFPKN